MNKNCQNCPYMQSHTERHSSKGSFRRAVRKGLLILCLVMAAAFAAANWDQVSLIGEAFHDHQLGEGGFVEPGFHYVARSWMEAQNARAELVQAIEHSDTVRFLLPSGDVYLGPFDSAVVLWSGNVRIRNGGATFTIPPDDVAFFRGREPT